MVIISTTEHSMPNSRFNTSNVSDPHSSIGRSWWWSPFTDKETEAQGQPAVSGGLSSSETPLLCPPCKAASQFACLTPSFIFYLTLGPGRQGQGLCELPSESNKGAGSSCPRWRGTCGVGGIGSGVRSHGITLGHRGQIPSHLVSLCVLICRMRRLERTQCPSLQFTVQGQKGDPGMFLFVARTAWGAPWGAEDDSGSSGPSPWTPSCLSLCHSVPGD